MTTYRRPRITDWVAGLLVGCLTGALILGGGGRIGMGLIALGEGGTPGFTFGGSLAVVFMGAVAGAVVATFFLVSRALLPHRRGLRATLFWLLVGAFLARGLNPVSVVAAGVFAPLFLVHGVLLYGYWCHVRIPNTQRAGA